MDPITIVGLVATSAKLASLCINTANALHALHTKQSRAAESLVAIKQECGSLGAAVEGIKVWAKSSAARSESRKVQCEALDQALQNLIPSVQVLAEDVDKIMKKAEDGSLGVGAKFKYLWKEEEMRAHLDEIRWQSHHIHILLTTINL
jgi:hypothetical protein